MVAVLLLLAVLVLIVLLGLGLVPDSRQPDRSWYPPGPDQRPPP
jgi:hypothetical protein